MATPESTAGADAEEVNVSATLERGIRACREGDWEEGLALLGGLADRNIQDLPGLFYSWLGYGIALHEKRYRDGLRLCEHAVKKQFYEADNFYNLARTRMLLDDRPKAVDAVRQGLRLHPRHRGLRKLERTLGRRNRPVLPFLSRSNPLNRLLGKLRHDLRGSSNSPW